MLRLLFFCCCCWYLPVLAQPAARPPQVLSAATASGVQQNHTDTPEDYSLHYDGRATTALVGDGKYIVKTAPDYFESVKVLPLQGRLLFSRQGDHLLPASTLWQSTVFPGGVRYTIRTGKDSIQVSYGVLPGAGFTVLAETPLNVETTLRLEKGNLPAVSKRVGDTRLQFYCQHPDELPAFGSSEAFRESLEAPYRRGLLVETPLPTLNKAVAFSQYLLDLSYNGELMYCELFRWLDIWARDLGSGLLPGALVSGRPAMARQSLVYDLDRYASMKPEDCKNSNDPSQGGTASEVGWTVRSVWNYYQYSGRIDSLRKDAAVMRPWVEHWIQRDYDDDGLITDVTDFMDHMIMMLSTNGVQTLASNSMYASLLYYAARIEKELGNKRSATRYEQLYHRTVNALNTRFWNEDKGYFSNLLLWDSICHRSSQASQAMLLKIGATDAARTRRTLEYLQQNNWTPYGSVTITPRMNHVDMDNDQNVKIWPWWNLWEAEARFGHGDHAGGLHLLERAAATINDEKYPGLIEETLDTTGLSTGGNVFVTAAGNLLETVVKDLMGIAPVTPGWQTVQVLPAVPAAWQRYRCRMPTPNGGIDASYENGRLYITVSDPGIRQVLVKDTANTTVNGAAKRLWKDAAGNNDYAYTPVAAPAGLPFRGGKAVLLYDAVLHGAKPALDMETIGLNGLEKLGTGAYTQLVIPGSSLPLRTPAGKPVKELLDRFLEKGGTVVLYGARTNAKTEEDGAGILGEQSGLIDWYDSLPKRLRTPIDSWQFEPFDNNPEGTRRNGSYSSSFVLDNSYRDKDLYIELGAITGLDSVFVNGTAVAHYRDMEPLIRQEYPTRTRYRDTHRYKMLSRYYIIKAGSPAYSAFRFGSRNEIRVHLYNDGLNRGIPESNQASIGIMTTASAWQPVDEALPGIGLMQPKRKGINYWGSEQFFNSWSTKHGLFGFKIAGRGLFLPAGSPLSGDAADLPVEDIYTDFALFKPWRFEALAYTQTHTALLYPGTTERYPCAARIINTKTGGNFIVLAPAIAASPLGKTFLQQLQIDSHKR